MEFPELMSPQFDSVEARTLLALCQKVQLESPTKTSDDFQLDFPALKNWRLCENLSPTDSTALDDFWQVWQNTVQPHQYVIALTASDKAVTEDCADLMMPLVKARISIPDLPEFNLATDDLSETVAAGVHAGFAMRLMLALSASSRSLILTLAKLAALSFVSDDKLECYITGHGQAGSVALLLTAFIRHSELLSGIKTKTYAFAPLRPGNESFSAGLFRHGKNSGGCFSVCNSRDGFTSLPLTIQTPRDLADVFHKSLVGPSASGLQITGVIEQSLESLVEKLNHQIETVAELVADQPLISIDSEYGSVETEAGLLRLIESLRSNMIPSLNYTRAGFCIPLTGQSPEANDRDMCAEHNMGTYQKLLDELANA